MIYVSHSLGNNISWLWNYFVMFTCFFQKSLSPIELKYHINTPPGGETKYYTNGFGRITMMATVPIYGIKPFKNLLQNQKELTLGLGM